MNDWPLYYPLRADEHDQSLLEITLVGHEITAVDLGPDEHKQARAVILSLTDGRKVFFGSSEGLLLFAEEGCPKA